MIIKRVTYIGGMVKNKSEKDKLAKLEFNENELPKEIFNVIEETKIYEIPGIYGDQKIGNPIQYDRLEIKYENKTVVIEAYNIAIFIYFAEDPYIKRVFKVLRSVSTVGKKEKINSEKIELHSKKNLAKAGIFFLFNPRACKGIPSGKARGNSEI